MVLWTSAGAAASIVAYLMIGYVVAARLSAPVRQPVERTRRPEHRRALFKRLVGR